MSLFLKGLLLKIFPSFGPKGLIDTQISVYKRIKKKLPYASENDILNSLIMSRINTPLSPSTKHEERLHYESILQNTNKKLEDVIWAMFEYENIISRKAELDLQLQKIDAQPAEITQEYQKWKKYIKERTSKIKPQKRKEKIRKYYTSTDNKDDIEELIKTISLILNTTEAKLNEKDKKLLFSKKSREEIKNLSDEQKKSLGKFYDNLTRGYILLAIKGYEFSKVDRVEEKFGSTIEENYPEASKSFIKFARTYWTFQTHLLEDLTGSSNYLAYLYLANLHAIIASIFFPMPGPATIPSNKREKDQREILKDFDMDIEDFIKGNPILIRDRQSGI
jgi:hypothetical protein